MNSYGSVSRVSESIYKLLRYMNWISDDDDAPCNAGAMHVVQNEKSNTR